MSHLLEHFTKPKIFHSTDYEDYNIISVFRFLPLCLSHGKHGCILNTLILYLLFIYTCRYDIDIHDVCTYGSYRSRYCRYRQCVCVFVVCVYLTFPKGRHTFSCSIYHLLSNNKTIENVYFIVLPKVFLVSYLISGS